MLNETVATINPVHIGYSIKEKGSIEDPDKLYHEEISYIASLYGFTNEDLELALEQGVAVNNKYTVEPIF